MSLNHPGFAKYSVSQLEKIGNTIVYLSDRIDNLSKTKLLKLLYILDELSIKNSGIPFLNLNYKLWRLGPVAEDIFIDLSSRAVLLDKFIEKHITSEGKTYISAKKDFCDDEFSDNDMDLINYVIEKYGHKSAKELVEYTHRVNSPWYNTAVENRVLEIMESNQTNSTNFTIDMAQLVSYDKKKYELYKDYIESF